MLHLEISTYIAAWSTIPDQQALTLSSL